METCQVFNFPTQKSKAVSPQNGTTLRWSERRLEDRGLAQRGLSHIEGEAETIDHLLNDLYKPAGSLWGHEYILDQVGDIQGDIIPAMREAALLRWVSHVRIGTADQPEFPLVFEAAPFVEGQPVCIQAQLVIAEIDVLDQTSPNMENARREAVFDLLILSAGIARQGFSHPFERGPDGQACVVQGVKTPHGSGLCFADMPAVDDRVPPPGKHQRRLIGHDRHCGAPLPIFSRRSQRPGNGPLEGIIEMIEAAKEERLASQQGDELRDIAVAPKDCLWLKLSRVELVGVEEISGGQNLPFLCGTARQWSYKHYPPL